MMNETLKTKTINIGKFIGIFVAIVVGLILLIFVGGSLFITLVSEGDLSPKSFDSTTWKQCPRSHEGEQQRQEMLKDLTSRYQLIGMTEKELIDLLGTDDGYVKTKYSTDPPGAWQHTYRLGSPSMNPMDLRVKVLLIRIQNSKVSEYKIKNYGD